MENSVTLSLVEYEMLAGIKKDFDEKLKSELKRRNDIDRAFVLRDRDEYVRRSELLFKEKTDAQERIRKVSEENVKLRVELDMLKGKLETLTGVVAHSKWSEEESERKLNEAKAEIRKRDKNEKTFLDEINRIRRERNRALARYDDLLGRGLFARIFNRG